MDIFTVPDSSQRLVCCSSLSLSLSLSFHYPGIFKIVPLLFLQYLVIDTMDYFDFGLISI